MEDIALSEREGRSQKDKQVKKGDEWNVENLRKGRLHERGGVMEVEKMSELEDEVRKSLTVLDQNVMLGPNEDKEGTKVWHRGKWKRVKRVNQGENVKRKEENKENEYSKGLKRELMAEEGVVRDEREGQGKRLRIQDMTS